jgi:hypothetical protein
MDTRALIDGVRDAYRAAALYTDRGRVALVDGEGRRRGVRIARGIDLGRLDERRPSRSGRLKIVSGIDPVRLDERRPSRS